MESTLKAQSKNKVQPLCPIFNECGGCSYQNISYEDELKTKETHLKNLLCDSLHISDDAFTNIISSPKPYHYRNRLDLKLKRAKDKNIFIGFTPPDKKGVIPIEACYIAEQNISDFIPELKRQAIERLPEKYRNANLTVRTGDDRRIHWGGIGRRSCQLQEHNYFWTEISGRKIFYSLDTFFQANLSILPKLFTEIRNLPIWNARPIFYDLYGGVGLFGIGFIDIVKRVVLIENSSQSLKIARYNVNFNKLENFQIINGKVEDHLPNMIKIKTDNSHVAMIDPPRAGLSEHARCLLARMKELHYILYLSCNPESLAKDLSEFLKQGWKVRNIIPFDFFPKTKHLETLVLLKL